MNTKLNAMQEKANDAVIAFREKQTEANVEFEEMRKNIERLENRINDLRAENRKLEVRNGTIIARMRRLFNYYNPIFRLNYSSPLYIY